MSLMDSIVGLVAPPVCVGCGSEGTALCQACSASGLVPYGEHCYQCGRASYRARTCPSCRRPGAPRHVWITAHYELMAQELLKTYKFGHLRAASRQIADLLVETMFDFITDSEIERLNYLLVPLPSATIRIRERGFDHVELLAKSIAKQTGMTRINALRRLGQQRQVGSHRDVRLKQMQGNFTARYPFQIKGRNILLIDDVVTTGATLRAATAALRQAGAARVDALIFAKKL